MGVGGARSEAASGRRMSGWEGEWMDEWIGGLVFGCVTHD